MALLTPQSLAYPSTAPVLSAVNASDTCLPADDRRLMVKNGSGAGITVTVSSFPDTSVWGTTIPDLVVTVAAGETRFIGPLRGTPHADPATGLVTFTYSSTTTITAALVDD